MLTTAREFESDPAPLIAQCTNRRKGAKPEIWFRIVHVTVADSLSQNEQIVEVALGPKPAFGNDSVTRLSRLVAANRVVSPVPPSRQKKAQRRGMTREMRKAALLQKAVEWRRQLDAVEVASQAEIARREGISRARVTQVIRFLRVMSGTVPCGE